MKEKECIKCGDRKTIDEFYPGRGKYKRRSECMKCNRKVKGKSKPGFWWDVKDKSIWKGFSVEHEEAVRIVN